MKHEPPPVRTHSPDETLPPPIHPEEEQTLLARWLQGMMEKGVSFWFFALSTVAIVVLAGYLIRNLMGNTSTSGRAWTEVMVATSTEDYQRVAETEGETPAGRWAALRAATSRYSDAMKRLPADRDEAAPLLKQALEGFQAIGADTKADPALQRLAILGEARTLETQGDLPEAIAAYEKLAKTWSDTDDGKDAAKRAERLKSPEVVAFYKKFATYKPTFGSSTLPPRGTGRFDLPSGHPPLDGPSVFAPPIGGVPAGATAVKPGELPADPFQKTAAEKKAEQFPDVFPKDEPKPAPLPK